MLKFARNKLVSIERKEEEILGVHGVLDDDIYGLEVDLTIGINDLKIRSIQGKWNRWTTPECPRAVSFLQDAVGMCIEEDGFSGKVQKIIGRKACRHFANLILECCHSAKEAALLSRWQDAKQEEEKDLDFEQFLKSSSNEKGPGRPASASDAPAEGGKAEKAEVSPASAENSSFESTFHAKDGGTIIDLHIHTSPASQCSMAPVGEIIEEARRIGLDGICFTDHNYVWDPDTIEDLRQKHGFLILRGNEITTDQGDMIVFGLEEDIKGIIKLEDLRRKVDTAKGFIIVAHPFRGFLTFGVGKLGLTTEKAMARPLFKFVDAVEVLNGKVTGKENNFAAEVGRRLELPLTGGSDAHEVSEVGTYATQFPATISGENDLVGALKQGEYTPVHFRRDAAIQEK